MRTLLLRSILFALPMVVRRAAKKHKTVRDKLQSGHCVVQLRMRDRSLCRHYVFKNGTVTGVPGAHSPAGRGNGVRERGDRARHGQSQSGLTPSSSMR